ncbi:MAG TPA: hypothetical protein VFA98_13255 [Thermoanaerobaculia bacterium]|jgi:hypothetical protein|nr:hypothetical protein [Thermoanaerobaculia bacterium]
MIGAEILALVAILFGGGYGSFLLFRSAKKRDALRKRAALQEDLLHDDLRAALGKTDHRAIDEFLALWGDKLSKERRAEIERIREDRYVSDDARERETRNEVPHPAKKVSR